MLDVVNLASRILDQVRGHLHGGAVRRQPIILALGPSVLFGCGRLVLGGGLVRVSGAAVRIVRGLAVRRKTFLSCLDVHVLYPVVAGLLGIVPSFGGIGLVLLKAGDLAPQSGVLIRKGLDGLLQGVDPRLHFEQPLLTGRILGPSCAGEQRRGQEDAGCRHTEISRGAGPGRCAQAGQFGFLQVSQWRRPSSSPVSGQWPWKRFYATPESHEGGYLSRRMVLSSHS